MKDRKKEGAAGENKKKKKKRSARGVGGEREEDFVQWGAEGL